MKKCGLLVGLLATTMALGACSNETKRSGAITLSSEESSVVNTSETVDFETSTNGTSERDSSDTLESDSQGESESSMIENKYPNSLVAFVEECPKEEGEVWFNEVRSGTSGELLDMSDLPSESSMTISDRMLSVLNQTDNTYFHAEKVVKPYFEDPDTKEVSLPYTWWAIYKSVTEMNCVEEFMYGNRQSKKGGRVRVDYIEYEDDSFLYNGDPRVWGIEQEKSKNRNPEDGYEQFAFWGTLGQDDVWELSRIVFDSGEEFFECSIYHYNRTQKCCYIFDISGELPGKSNEYAEEQRDWFETCITYVESSIPVREFMDEDLNSGEYKSTN